MVWSGGEQTSRSQLRNCGLITLTLRTKCNPRVTKLILTLSPCFRRIYKCIACVFKLEVWEWNWGHGGMMQTDMVRTLIIINDRDICYIRYLSKMLERPLSQVICNSLKQPSFVWRRRCPNFRVSGVRGLSPVLLSNDFSKSKHFGAGFVHTSPIEKLPV